MPLRIFSNEFRIVWFKTKCLIDVRAGFPHLVEDEGYSGFVAAQNRVYTQYQSLRGQFVLCLDAHTGDTLWEKVLGGTISGFPISYAVDGVQYVAIAVGGGGGGIPAWSFVSGVTTTRPGGNALYVFSLGK